MIFFRANKEEKVKKPKSKRRYKRIYQIILWIMISLIFAKGLISIIRKDQTETLRSDITSTLAEKEKQQKNQVKVVGFAEDFITVWLSGDDDLDKYKKNLAKYTNKDMTSNSKKADIKINSITLVDFIWVGDKALVDMKISTEYSEKPLQSPSPSPSASAKKTTSSPKVSESPSPKSENVAKDICVRVPVVIKEDGNCLIENYPVFIADKQKSSGSSSSDIDGDKVEDSEANDISKAVKGFLNAYCDGNDTDMSYYVSNETKIKGLDKSVRFVDIDKIDTKKKSDKYYVDVTYKVEDETGIFYQQVQIIFVKDSKNKYMVSEFNSIVK